MTEIFEFCELPNELQILVFAYCDAKTLATLAIVSSSFRLMSYFTVNRRLKSLQDILFYNQSIDKCSKLKSEFDIKGTRASKLIFSSFSPSDFAIDSRSDTQTVEMRLINSAADPTAVAPTENLKSSDILSSAYTNLKFILDLNHSSQKVNQPSSVASMVVEEGIPFGVLDIRIGLLVKTRVGLKSGYDGFSSLFTLFKSMQRIYTSWSNDSISKSTQVRSKRGECYVSYELEKGMILPPICLNADYEMRKYDVKVTEIFFNKLYLLSKIEGVEGISNIHPRLLYLNHKMLS